MAAVGAAVATSLDMLDASAYDPWVACLPPAHIGGLLVYLRGVLTGSPVTVLERFEPGALLATAPPSAHVSLVPTMLERLVRGGADLGSLGELLVGGGPLDPALRDAAVRLGARIVNTYGSTETCGGVVYDGRPFAGTEIRIAADVGEPSGPVEVRGPTLMDGYRFDPAATAEVFTRDGWLRTGDIGSFGSEGHLRIAGRADDAIRSGAETVWPAEVEEVLVRHPKVADVAVAGRPDPEWGSHVTAWVVAADPSAPPSLEELREYCRDDLARYKAPRDLRLVTTLPRTPGGKIRRGALP
jgi:O-succinylbenzoic acid--CoA ligase